MTLLPSTNQPGRPTKERMRLGLRPFRPRSPVRPEAPPPGPTEICAWLLTAPAGPLGRDESSRPRSLLHRPTTTKPRGGRGAAGYYVPAARSPPPAGHDPNRAPAPSPLARWPATPAPAIPVRHGDLVPTRGSRTCAHLSAPIDHERSSRPRPMSVIRFAFGHDHCPQTTDCVFEVSRLERPRRRDGDRSPLLGAGALFLQPPPVGSPRIETAEPSPARAYPPLPPNPRDVREIVGPAGSETSPGRRAPRPVIPAGSFEKRLRWPSASDAGRRPNGSAPCRPPPLYQTPPHHGAVGRPAAPLPDPLDRAGSPATGPYYLNFVWARGSGKALRRWSVPPGDMLRPRRAGPRLANGDRPPPCQACPTGFFRKRIREPAIIRPARLRRGCAARATNFVDCPEPARAPARRA